MATAQEEPAERSLKKEVVMVGYFNEQNLDMDRFKTLVTGTDLEAKKSRTSEEWEFEIGMADIFDDDYAVFNYTAHTEMQKEKIEEKIKESDVPETRFSVEYHREVKTSKKNSEYTAKKGLMSELANGLPDELPPELDIDVGSTIKWKDESMESNITIGRPDFGKRRVHTKEAERSEGNMYETVADYPSVSFNITLEAESEEQMDLYTEEVIVNLHKALAKREGIGKVRYISCTTQEERHGECYAF